MSQHDMDIANQSGAGFRSDLNSALQASASNQSGGTAPPVTYPYQFWADTSAGLLRMRNGANTAWVTIGLLGVPNFGHIMPGTIVYHAKSAVPSGFLKANGGAVSRFTYADLFAEIGTTFGAGDGSTTFNLPELRAEFIRGWDDSRGIDTSRVFASSQLDELKAHTHNLNLKNSASSGTGSGVLRSTDTDVVASGPIGATGGIETRPRNIALLACIKF